MRTKLQRQGTLPKGQCSGPPTYANSDDHPTIDITTMISWSTLQTLLLVVGPFAWSKGKSFYNSSRVSSPPLPLPSSTRTTLNILFITAFVALLTTTPYFTPENVFTATSSRLFHTPADVLFTRLSKLRELTPADEVLRSRLQSKEGRIVYAKYGPQPLVECNWCTIEEPETFFYYLLPRIVLAHLAHIFVLGVVTSGGFSRWGRIWRTQATIAGLGLLLAEVTALRNIGVANGLDVIWVFWRVAMGRGVGMAAVDAVIGAMVWLTATRRWNFGWDQKVLEERLEGIEKNLGAAAGILQGTYFVKQGVLRDQGLRNKMEEWWTHEVRAGRDAEDDDEVRKIKLDSLPQRMEMGKLEEEAKVKSEGLMRNIASMRPPRPKPQTENTEE